MLPFDLLWPSPLILQKTRCCLPDHKARHWTECCWRHFRQRSAPCHCSDLLIKEAALVHETNGRKPHYEDEDDFDSMQARHDAMTVAGLTVLHNSPRLIAREGPRVLADLEHCYLRDDGKGLPPGVRIIRTSNVTLPLAG